MPKKTKPSKRLEHLPTEQLMLVVSRLVEINKNKTNLKNKTKSKELSQAWGRKQKRLFNQFNAVVDECESLNKSPETIKSFQNLFHDLSVSAYLKLDKQAALIGKAPLIFDKKFSIKTDLKNVPKPHDRNRSYFLSELLEPFLYEWRNQRIEFVTNLDSGIEALRLWMGEQNLSYSDFGYSTDKIFRQSLSCIKF